VNMPMRCPIQRPCAPCTPCGVTKENKIQATLNGTGKRSPRRRYAPSDC
jgi:hypothetical protein